MILRLPKTPLRLSQEWQSGAAGIHVPRPPRLRDMIYMQISVVVVHVQVQNNYLKSRYNWFCGFRMFVSSKT